MRDAPLRLRFAPSPTGYLHVGGARTALFNWLLAKKSGGTLVLRIEDTDRSRHVADSVEKIVQDMRWLGLEWDEGPEVGGDHGPYFQSERLEFYRKYTDQLIEQGKAYYALETPQELQAARLAARKEKRSYAYKRPDPLPTCEEADAARQEGKPVTVRFATPGKDLVIQDEILGEVRLASQEIEDFVIQKGDGWPTYHLACVVDDELMKINYVIRGQEHLINTPKHVALQEALGFSTPRYAHLPLIFNMAGAKMSKREKLTTIRERLGQATKGYKAGTPEAEGFYSKLYEVVGGAAVVDALGEGKADEAILEKFATFFGLELPEVNVHDFRLGGYLPEALLNFMSLLGWSAGDDREQLTLAETVELFDVDRIGKANARFDRKKLIAFNTDWCQKVTPERLVEGFGDYLEQTGSPMASAGAAVKIHLLSVCAGFRTFRELESKCGPLFVENDRIVFNPKAVKKLLVRGDRAGYKMLAKVLPELDACPTWSPKELEALFERLCADYDTKLGNVAQPIRVAVTGTNVSPPIFDTLAILGKEKTIARIQQCSSLQEE